MTAVKEFPSKTSEFLVEQTGIEAIEDRIRAYSYDYDITRTAEANAENSEVEAMLQRAREHAQEKKEFFTLLKSSLTTGGFLLSPEYNPHKNDKTYVPGCDVLLEGRSFKLGLFAVMDTVNLLTSETDNASRVSIVQSIQNGELISFRRAPNPPQG